MSDPGTFWYCAVTGLAGGVAVCGGLAERTARSGGRGPTSFRRFSAVMLGGLGVLGLLTHEPAAVAVFCLVPATALGLAGLLTHPVLSRAGGVLHRELAQKHCLVLAGLVVGAASGWQARESAVDDPAARLPADPSGLPPPRLLPARAGAAVTDLGTPVPRYEPADYFRTLDELRAGDERCIASWNLYGRVLRVAPPDPACNCYGWVFDAGRHTLYPEAVPLILRENGYRPVAAPAVGDVAVYYDPAGTVVHAGVVHSAADGLVLVESKWGWLSRFLHHADAVPYAADCVYYRTDRGDHAVKEPGR